MTIRAKKNILTLVGAEGIGRMGILFITSIGARLLSEEQFASYLVVWALVGVAWVLGQLGTSVVGVRELSSAKNEADKQSVIASILIIRFGMSAAVILLILVMSNFLAPGVNRFLLVVGLSVVLLRAVTFDWVLRASQRNIELAIAIIGGTTLMCLLGYVLVTIDRSANALVLAHAAGVFFIAVAVLLALRIRVRLRVCLGRASKVSVMRLMKASATVGFAGVALVVSQAIPLLAIHYSGDVAATANFGALQRILQLCLAVLFILSVSHFPALARQTDDQCEHAFKHYLADLILTSFWLFALFSFGADYVVGLVLGVKYSGVSIFLPFVMFLVPIYFLRTALTDTLIARNRTRTVLIACLFALLATVIMSYSLIPYVSDGIRIHVAIGVLAIGELIVLGFSVAVLKKTNYYEIFRGNFKLIMLTLIGTVCMAIAVMMPEGNDLLRLILVVASLLTTLVWYRSSSVWFGKVI